MKTKKLILIIMLLLFAQFACADKITILNLHYDRGEVSVIDKIDTYGYYPDRKIQPDIGYKAEVVSVDDAVLYSFKFEVPLEHYTDIHLDNRTQGGLVIVNETDFALIIPSLPTAKEVNFYNEKNVKVLTVGLIEEKLIPTMPIIIGLAIIFVIIISMALKKRKT
ncbi:hypothetical protein KY361_06170 [Candidatus Woesearchaeota archaeon]|nr:hypothetical protein [Candidatus Woesearchaeota archaeon]